jgi:hypothetical protein
MARDQGNGAALSNDYDLHKPSSLLFLQKMIKVKRRPDDKKILGSI